MARFRKSLVWKYFDKKDKETVICKLCEKELRFNSSTTNMRAHLKCKNHAHLKLDTIGSDEGYEENDVSTSSMEVSENTTSRKRYNSFGPFHHLIRPKRLRSIYWNYFGFPASESGSMLSKNRIICILCNRDISYNGNTSSLKTHLQHKHAGELADLQCPQEEIIESTERTDINSIKTKEEIVVESNQFINVSATGVDEFESDEQFENCEMNDIESSHLNGVYSNKVNVGMTSAPNKSNMEMVSVVEENCCIESVHPFMMPMESKSISEAVTDFIVMDMHLPDIVEGKGFQRLIASLQAPCEIPAKTRLINEIIPKEHENLKESVRETLHNIKYHISLSVEEWKSNSGDSYVTFSVIYQQETEEVLMNKVLTTVLANSSSDTYWENMFNNLLEEWNLKLENMKVAVCATTQQELLNTLTKKGLVVVPCLVYTLQEVCSKVCFRQTDVQEVLTKCRTLIYLIYKTNSALTTLRIQDHLMLLDETPLVSDNEKVWLSTYSMLEAVLARRQVIRTILDNIDPNSYDKEVVNFSDHDWVLIEDIVTVLEPFKVIMMSLSEERSPLISLLKPLLWQLINSHLTSKDEDSVNARLFKSALRNMLIEKYSSPELNELLHIATSLDPRFKSLPNLLEELKPCLDGPIRENLIKIIDDTPRDVKAMVETSDKPEKKKPRLLGMVMMLGDMCPAMPPAAPMPSEDRAKLELIQYQSEESAPLDQCPFAWWRQITAKCPHLSRLAKQYSCIPATAIPLGRITLESYLTYMVKRANLIPEVIDRIIFLNANSTL